MTEPPRPSRSLDPSPRTGLRVWLTRLLSRPRVVPVPELPSALPAAVSSPPQAPGGFAEPAIHATSSDARGVGSWWRRGAQIVTFVGTAVAAGWAFRSFYGGPMLPNLAFALGSPAWLLAGAVAQLRRRRSPEPPAARRGRRPNPGHVLAWIGVMWAALALF